MPDGEQRYVHLLIADRAESRDFTRQGGGDRKIRDVAIPIVEWSVRGTGEVELWDPAMRRSNWWGEIKPRGRNPGAFHIEAATGFEPVYTALRAAA